ncbi:septation protein SepH, partial [Acrocarpospora phusangensis]|uniref:septation protein SepH n=1 Tax=Acrocarpospora phusangensis TaxID=1070424 RepID=UPI0019522A3B
MQELRLVAVSEDGTYLVLATAGRGTRFTLPVDDRLRAAVRGNFSRLGQYEIEVESPLRPKEIQARIRAGETAEEIAATAGIPVERVRWFEGPVLQEREYVAQQAQRVAVRLPGENTPRPTLGELVAERLTRRGVPADEIDWDSCKRDDNLWRIKLGFVWNGHTRHAEWLFDPRRRHITPYDDEALRLSAAEYVDPPQEEATVRPFVPRLAGKLAPVPAFEPRFEPEPAAPYAEPGGFTDPSYQDPAYLQRYTEPTPLPSPTPVRPAAFHPEHRPMPVPAFLPEDPAPASPVRPLPEATPLPYPAAASPTFAGPNPTPAPAAYAEPTRPAAPAVSYSEPPFLGANPAPVVPTPEARPAAGTVSGPQVPHTVADSPTPSSVAGSASGASADTKPLDPTASSVPGPASGASADAKTLDPATSSV